MFVSRPPFEFAVPDQLRSPGERYWRAIALSMQVPWYMATFESELDEGTYVHSICFCWEVDLLAAIDEASPSALRSLQMVRPPRGRQAAWSMCPIARIWRLVGSPTLGESHFIFEDEKGTCLCPMSGSEVASDFHRREVAAEVVGRRSPS